MSEAQTILERTTPRGNGETLLAGIHRGFASIADSRTLSAACILIVAVLMFLPGFFSLPPIDRDEPNFANASRTMLETGNFVDIRIQDQPRSNKPAGIYWLQAAAVWATGGAAKAAIYDYRLPSLFGAIAAALLTWWMALAFGRKQAALLAGLLMAAAILLSVEARLAKTDAVLLAMVTLAQGSLSRIWLQYRPSRLVLYQAAFWTAIGAATLIKGPIAIGVAGLTAAVLTVEAGSTAWLKRLLPLWGVAWALLLVLPWLIAITVSSHGGFWEASIGKDLFGKIASAQEKHGAPPGYFLVLAFVTFWPGMIFFALAWSFVLDHLRRPVVLFGLAWILPFWLICEAIPTKLPHYVLPTYPAIALLAATAIDEGRLRLDSRVRQFFAVAPFGVPVTALVLLPALFYVLEGRIPVAGIAWLLVASVAGFLAWRLLVTARDQLASALMSVVAAGLTGFALFGEIAPDLTQVQVSGRVVAAARAASGCANPVIAASGFAEPSLLFLAGSSSLLGGGSDAADFLAKDGCRVAAIETSSAEAFLSRAQDLGFDVSERGKVGGLNLSNGDRVTVTLYVRSGT